MATRTVKQFGQAQINNAAPTVLYTAPSTAESYGLVLDVQICNTNANSRTFDLWVYPAVGAAIDATAILKTFPIGGKRVIPVNNRKIVIPAGGSIAAQSSDDATSLTITVSGVEYDTA